MMCVHDNYASAAGHSKTYGWLENPTLILSFVLMIECSGLLVENSR